MQKIFFGGKMRAGRGFLKGSLRVPSLFAFCLKVQKCVIFALFLIGD